MRCSSLVLILLLAACSRRQAPVFRRIAILPIENLSADPGLNVGAAAVQWAIWDALQAQPTLHAVLAGHRRNLPELQPAYTVEGYVAAGRFQLRLNADPVECAGTLDDCAVRIVKAIATKVGVTPRATPKTETLRILAQAGPAAPMEKAAALSPDSSAAWIGWSAQALQQGGPQAALAALNNAPLTTMPPYDAARIRVRLAELRQDRKAHALAMIALARVAPADVDLQEQAAREAAASREFAAAAQIYDRLNAIAPDPRILNQSAYLAAFSNDRAKAEQYANAAQTAAPNDPRYTDTRGEIAYFFGDHANARLFFEQAAGLDVTFLGGLELWKAADAARLAGDKTRAESLLARYLEFKTKSGLRNTILLQAIWAWHGNEPDAAMEKLRAAAGSLDRGRALFLQSLIALNRGELAQAERIRQQMEPASMESAFLTSLLTGAPPPPGLPFPPDAIAALYHYVHKDNKAAAESLARARLNMDPFNEGQWRKLDAILQGKKPQGLLPPSPDDWLAVLLH